jgi:hypothetical protein
VNDRAQVELTVRYGPFSSESKTVAVQIPADLARELMGHVELSDEPFSLMLASPGMFGGHDSAVSIRQRAFKMRSQVAKDIAAAMVPALLEAFGVNDELDGYRVADMPESEREFYRQRGRLPKDRP